MSARWTDSEYQEYMARHKTPTLHHGETRAWETRGAAGKAGEPRAKRLDGYASAVEARYALLLEEEKRDGILKAWWYEPFSLKLAPKLHYRPDFLLDQADIGLVIVEVKGPYIREDSMIKLKMAAKLFPCFTFQLAQEINRQWQIKDMPYR